MFCSNPLFCNPLFQTLIQGYGFSLLLAFLCLGVELSRGNRSIPYLKDTVPNDQLSESEWPTLSIIIPARNEAQTIRTALTSVLNLQYPQLEIIVINDRSEDETGRILEQIARQYPALRVIHLTELPPGWLGKNHALQYGITRAKGEFLLLTDADVHYEPQTLRRAITRMLCDNLDHLTLVPHLTYRDAWLTPLFGIFSIFFFQHHKLWKVTDPKSPYYAGIGAFNLIRKTALDAVDGFSAIAMRPDDDMKLGKLLKQQGYRQAALFGMDCISVEWYPNVYAFIRGLMKNTFAFMDYSVLWTLLGCLGIFAFNVLPFILLGVAQGPALGILCLLMILMAGFYIDHCKRLAIPSWGFLLIPVSSLVFIYIMMASMVLTLRQRGIYWRDTFYPLSALKANAIYYSGG